MAKTGHTTDDATRTPDAFKADLVEAMEDHHDRAHPNKVGAFNPAGLLHKVDLAAQKFAPLIKTLTPDQYDVLVDAVAGLIHAGDRLVNPAS